MSERRAKLLRRESRQRGDKLHIPVQNPPHLIPMPTGELDENGEKILKPTFIDRKTRRKMLRYIMTSLRKGRISPQQLQEAEAK